MVRTIGTSREGRPLSGHVLGRGPLRVSLIAGCHGDEPMGPAWLAGLVDHLADPDHPWLSRATFRIVPCANPDAAHTNDGWWKGGSGAGDLASFLVHRVRELPGDDLEFGFPGHPDGDDGIRPEAAAIASFLAEDGPVHLHGSLHGLAFAEGPWFLVEPAWEERLGVYRDACLAAARAEDLPVHDQDRGGEKGFRRLSEGFCTRPDSVAMRRHFLSHGDEATAALFRPSSMEFARSLGNDPFTFVTEVPLFRFPVGSGEAVRERLVPWSFELQRAARGGSFEAVADRVRGEVAALGIASLDPVVQKRLIGAQVAAALDLVETQGRNVAEP